jgi:hypothetical protein
VAAAASRRQRAPRLHHHDTIEERVMTAHPYADLWTTEDGFIRHELLPNGRYVESRGNRERVYKGRYEIRGDRIAYTDDAGFTAAGEFRRDVLYHAGMVLHRG